MTGFDLSDVLSIIGILTGICALAFTGWNVFVQRKHNRLSMKAHLQGSFLSNKKDKTSFLGFKIENKGIGPAIITKFQISIGGKDCELVDAVAEALKGKKYILRTASTLNVGSALSAKEVFTVGVVEFPCTSDQVFQEYGELLDHINLVVGYKSAYDDEDILNV